jgi:hypothetical protein
MNNDIIQTNLTLFRLLDSHINDIHTYIKNVIEAHRSLYEMINTKYDGGNYNLYIDDIFFHKNIISKEITSIEMMRMMVLRKFYGDLYKLYNKIIKYYLLVKEKKVTDNQSISKNFFTDLHIRTFTEIDVLTIYRYRDIENIYLHINNHITYIQNIYNETEKLLKDMSEKNKDFNILTFILTYNCENRKIEAEINIFKTILSHIIEKNKSYIEKLIKKTKLINEDITEHTEKRLSNHITFEPVSDEEDIENQMEEQIQNNNDITNSNQL